MSHQSQPKLKVESESAQPSPSSNTASPIPSPLPAGSYTDYSLYSSAPSRDTGWRHNLIKFASDKPVDPTAKDWAKPVKLNRKDPRLVIRLTEEERVKINEAKKAKLEAAAAAAKEAAKEAARENGEDVEEMDVDRKEDDTPVKSEEGGGVTNAKGKAKAQKEKEREEIDLTLIGTGKSGLAPVKATQKASGGIFKKKLKQTHVVSEEARRLNREEWAPWVLEDEPGQQRWIGRLEGGASASEVKEETLKKQNSATGTHGWRPAGNQADSGGGGSSYVAFVFGENGEDFKVVPVSRWYKFTRGPKFGTLGTEEAEGLYNNLQKSTENTRWIMHRRNGTTNSKPSSSSSGSGVNAHGRLLKKTANLEKEQQLAAVNPRSAKFKTVIQGSDGADAGDDDAGGKSKAKARQDQEEGEFDFDEDFADDEEGIAGADEQVDEEEAKELEERVKKEQRSANTFEAAEGLDDDDEDEDELTNAGKEVKKLMRKRDQSGLYDSDMDEDDDFLSGDDDTRSVASNGDRSRPSPSGSQSGRVSSQQASPSRQPHSSRPTHSSHASRTNSRSGSPIPGSGAAVVAKRATSPRPAGQAVGRRSPSVSRSGSPVPGASGSGAGTVKRKRTEGGGNESDTVKRKRANASPAPGNGTPSATPGLEAPTITQQQVVDFLKTRLDPPFSTGELLQQFRRQVRDPTNRTEIMAIIGRVCTLENKLLHLKPGF